MMMVITSLLMTAVAMSDSKPARVGTITDKRISEASGVSVSRQFKDVLWTHNDGPDGVLFAVHRDGALVGCAKIDAKIHDWEDIATDDRGNLYVADIGNNQHQRKHVIIHRIREPDPGTLKNEHPKPVVPIESRQVALPDDRPDMESFFAWRGFGYLVSKAAPGTRAQLYRFEWESRKQEPELVCTLPIDQPVTAAGIDVNGKDLAILTRGALFVFEIDGDPARARDAKFERIELSPIHNEGCAFATDEILIVAESGEIQSVPWKKLTKDEER